MTLRALVVDDEPLARDELSFLLSELSVEVLAEAPDATSALELCTRLSPDVVFVDLRMPGPDGLALAESLLLRRPELSIVVVSAHDDGALRAYEAGVLDYLLKPVRLDRLRKTLERVASDQASANTLPREEHGADGPQAPTERSDEPLTRLAIRRRGKFVVVGIEDVVYFEVRDELVWAVTDSDRFGLDLSLASIEGRVSKDEFFRSHRSALVRLSKIQGIEPAGAGTFELHLDHPLAPRLPLARGRARVLRQIIPIAG